MYCLCACVRVDVKEERQMVVLCFHSDFLRALETKSKRPVADIQAEI